MKGTSSIPTHESEVDTIILTESPTELIVEPTQIQQISTESANNKTSNSTPTVMLTENKHSFTLFPKVESNPTKNHISNIHHPDGNIIDIIRLQIKIR